MSDPSPVIVPEAVSQRRARGIHWLLSGGLGVALGLIAGIGIGLQSAPKAPAVKKPIVVNIQIDGQSAQLVGTPVWGDGLEGAQQVIGSSGAKITMVEFGDYRCSYCRVYEGETFPKLRREFVDSGKVRYAYRHTVTVGGDQTVAVSNAALCVADQGKFWAFHQLMFTQQERWEGFAPGAQLNITLSSLAQQVGADPQQVLSCLHVKRHAMQIEEDITAAATFGITGTPSFVINGYMFSGALPYEAYKQIFKHFGVS